MAELGGGNEEAPRPAGEHAPPKPSPRKPRKRASQPGLRLAAPAALERLAGAGVLLLGFALFAFQLITKSAVAPSLIGTQNVMLALFAGASLTLLAGYVEINGRALGLNIRAVGGAAAFFLVLLLLMNARAAPAGEGVSLRPLGTLDLRAAQAEVYDVTPAVLVLSIGFFNPEGDPVSVRALSAQLEAGASYAFVANHYTALEQNGPDRGWLPHEGRVMSGARFDATEEIAFYPRNPLAWRDFAETLLTSPPGILSVRVVAEVDGEERPITLECWADFSGAAAQGAQYRRLNSGALPRRVTVLSEPRCDA